MRDLTLNKWLLAALMLLMPWAADAAGLGRLTVVSALGQPFSAEIDLVSVSREDLASLTVQLASIDAYRQANLQYVGAAAGLRLAIEKRTDGQPYIRITSTRPINEPFLDLLIELNWASGRLVREYTALLDPPGYGTSPLAAAPLVTPEVRPAPIAPPPAPAPTPVAEPAPAIIAPAAAGSYGPIQRGETMGKIAGELKPEGVTLEQMLIALLRNNPDAFIQKNVNLVKAGKILRVPEKAEVAAIPPNEAANEFRTQVVDWNAYRQRVAEAAGMAPEARTTATGKITTRVEDTTAGGPKDVVKLSKGEPPGTAAGKGDKPPSAAARIRVLEEEVIARQKALAEANERVAQLEKTISDMKRLAEFKSPAMAAAQQQAVAKPGVKPAPAPPVVPAPKPEATPKPAPADMKKGAPATAAPADQPAAAPAVTAEPPKPKPKPKPRVVQPPPPPPEPELMDMVMENLPLIGGGALVLLGGLYFGLARRRRARAGGNRADGVAPMIGAAAETSSADDAEAGTDETRAARPSGDEVDPLAEAEVYVAYGRDAQAEEILKEAMAKEPSREDVQVKLLEIYSARKDKNAFGSLAQGLNRLTGGQGENWLKVAAMGYALDSANPLYEAGRDTAASMPPGEQESSDFDFKVDEAAAPVDNTYDQRTEADEDNTVVEPTMRRPADKAESGAPDIAFDEAGAGAMTADISFEAAGPGGPTATDIALDSGEGETKEGGGNAVDFDIELPKLDEPEDAAAASPAASDEAGTESGMDFKLDLEDINLSLDDRGEAAGETPAGADREKDTQWYDVQTKFDLAKAYQEMGDKDGAKEILQEVIKEGDAEQQAEAKKVLETLG